MISIGHDFTPPNEARGFVHKRLFGAAKGLVTGGFTGAASGFITGGSRPKRTTIAQPAVFNAPSRPTRSALTFGTGTRLDPSSTIFRELASTSGTACGPGMARDSRGNCVSEETLGGVRSVIARLLPGGSTGRALETSTEFGDAVLGAFNIPALEPAIVGDIQRNDGSTALIRRCPRGMVLGRDELCYPREILRRNSRFRKHRPGPRPILTGGQRSAIREAKSAILTARNAISGLGVTVTKKK